MQPSTKSHYTLAELTNGLNVRLQGNPDCIIYRIKPINIAQPGELTFLTNSTYRKYLTTTQASAIILNEKDVTEWQGNAVISSNPYFTYAKIAEFFAPKILNDQGIHSTAVIGNHCQIESTARISAHCVIGNHVHIGAHVDIGSGCVIGDGVHIGSNTTLAANVTIYQEVIIGQRCIISSGAVIGSDGFGFANDSGIWHAVPQLGKVVLGDDVAIGANTTIDRGALEDTLLENGVKLDNLIQVGHNVRIGENTIIAGCVAIAGSTNIGKNCMIGGGSCFAGHITICDQVIITGMTAVTKSITVSGMYSSGIVGAVPNLEFRKNNARFHRLENLMTRVKQLELNLKTIDLKTVEKDLND